MLRWGLLLGVWLSGCGPRCDQAVCAPYCADRAAAAPSVLSALDDHRLTVEEFDLLSSRLLAVREGVQVDGPTGFGVCEGSDTCARFLGFYPEDPLAVGSYMITARLRVPADGVYEAEWSFVCHDQRDGKGNELRRETRTVKFVYAEKPAEQVLARFAVEDRQRQFCDFALTPTTGWTPSGPLRGHIEGAAH